MQYIGGDLLVLFALTLHCIIIWAFQVALVVKNLLTGAGNIRDVGLIPGSGRSPGGGTASPSSILAWRIPPMDSGAWWATVRRVTKSWTQVKQLSTHACTS